MHAIFIVASFEDSFVVSLAPLTIHSQFSSLANSVQMAGRSTRVKPAEYRASGDACQLHQQATELLRRLATSPLPGALCRPLLQATLVLNQEKLAACRTPSAR